jgi:thiol-disulfide isomerase/thioredoxin
MRNILAAAVLPLLALGQTPPDAKALLKETTDILLKHKSYQLEQEAVIDLSGPTPFRMDMAVKMAASNPGKLRIEANSQAGDVVIVSDGENTWVYVGSLKQYTKAAAASNPESLVTSMMPGINDVTNQLQSRDTYVSAEIVREEPVDLGGQKKDCYVVEAKLAKIKLPGGIEMSGGIQKAWIDKASRLTLKQTVTANMQGGVIPDPVQVNQAVTVTSATLDAPVPDSEFAFTPPEGTREVKEFTAPVKIYADLTGQTAADFKLPAVDGKAVSLKDLHGQVVLLDFWATWCGPCRRDLPVFEKLHQEFSRSGLVVLGLNSGEEPEAVTKFLLTTKLSYPILLAAETGATRQYSVKALPTVVLIDREGKIVLYHVGTGSESELREKLAKLGLGNPPDKQAPK